MDWQQLQTESQVENIKQLSLDNPVVIFKHSTSCGISRMVLKSLERELSSRESIQSNLYYLDLLKFRSVSNKVAEMFDVVHQSPQVLIIEKGEVTYDASHYSIESENIK